MKARPLIMTANNAHKIHVGTKTQTRRLLRLPPWVNDSDLLKLALQRPATGLAYFVDGMPTKTLTCPYGLVGDRLWIREAYSRVGCKNDCGHIGCHTIYKGEAEKAIGAYGCVKWMSSLYMPRWACRTVVEITDLRVERVRNITEVDAIAEGIQKSIGGMWCGAPHHAHGAPKQFTTASEAFMDLWESIHGVGSWNANPWVWVITFRKVKI